MGITQTYTINIITHRPLRIMELCEICLLLLHRYLTTMASYIILIALALLPVSCAVYLDEPSGYPLARPYNSACLQCLFTHKREYCEICKYEDDGGNFLTTNKRSDYYNSNIRKRGYYCLCCARSRLTNSGCCTLCSSEM